MASHDDSRRRLVLWRHGRTEWNKLGKAQGHADISLDIVGVKQAARAAKYLATYEPAFVWSSDLARARETAEQLVALTGCEVVLDKRLREFDVGARRGMTFAEFREQFPAEYAAWEGRESEDILLRGAETAGEVAARMVEVLGDCADQIPSGRTGVVVGHGASLRVGLLAFLGLGPADWGIVFGMSNCAWAVLEEGRWGWQILDYNARTLPEPSQLADDPHA
ncbi:MAG: histidine phosphatase family protein [Nocardioidaceae bacterium]